MICSKMSLSDTKPRALNTMMMGISCLMYGRMPMILCPIALFLAPCNVHVMLYIDRVHKTFNFSNVHVILSTNRVHKTFNFSYVHVAFLNFIDEALNLFNLSTLQSSNLPNACKQTHCTRIIKPEILGHL